MSQLLNVQLCRIVAPDKLADRFLASGILRQPEGWSLASQAVLIYVFEITRPWFPSSSVIPSLTAVLTEQYSQLKSDETLGDQFELLLRAVNQQLNALSEQGETDWIGNLNGLIMVLGQDELHFSQTGTAPAYLLQNNRIRQITDDNGEHEPHPLKTFSNLASGGLKAGDQILIANRELYREISLDALRRIVSRGTPYQAGHTIAKELKRAKNPNVTSTIVRILTEKDTPPAEPVEILLEEEMQSAVRKAGKRLSPIVALLKHFSRKAGSFGMQAARQTGEVMKNTVAPAAGELIKKGAVGAKNLGEKVADKLAATPVPENGVVERIYPRAPLTSEEDQPEKPTRVNLEQLRSWLAETKHRKLVALISAALLITIVIGVALSRQKPTATPAVQNQNAAHLQQASDLSRKAATAIQQSQPSVATQDIAQAQQNLDALQSPTSAQTTQADTLNATLTTQSDVLTGTTRLISTSNYTFTAASSGLVAGLPYFYGYGTGGLLRTGKGTDSQVQETLKVPGSSDSIISMIKSDLGDSVAYALTQQDKVYRLVQSNGDSSLVAVQPGTGDSFAKGDVIGTYNGNIYILDSVTGLLWKYASTGTSYAKGASVIDKTKYDISGTASFAIDGSIYILKKSGVLLKFTSGNQNADFALKGIPVASQSWIQPRQVITDENTQSIYVLDAGLSTGSRSSARILVFGKDGNYVRQYAFPKEYTKVQGFDVDEKNKTLWVLNGSTVGEFTML